MANEITTTKSAGGYVAKQIGVGFYGAASLLAVVDTQYAKEFEGKSGGVEKGDTVYVNMPAEFKSTTETTITGGNTSKLKQVPVPIVMDGYVAIYTDVSLEEAALDIDQKSDKYSKEFLEPQGEQLAVDVEQPGFEEIANNSLNTIVMETPFADKEALRNAFIDVNSLLSEQLAPKGNRTTIVNPKVEAAVASSVQTFFHSSAQIDKAYEEATMDKHGGLMWMGSSYLHTRVNGAGGVAGLTVTAYTDGEETITVSDGSVFNVGDKFVMPGIDALNRRTKNPYGELLQRAVKAVNGNVLTIHPIYGGATDAQQNASAAPVATQAITVLGTQGGIYACCPVFQKNGITAASVKTYLPTSTEIAAQSSAHKMVMNFIRDYAITGGNNLTRNECLFKWKALRPEWLGNVEVKVG